VEVATETGEEPATALQILSVNKAAPTAEVNVF